MKKLIILLFYCLSTYSFSQSVEINKIFCGNYDQQVYNDPEVDYSKFKSFSLVSINQFLKKEQQSFLEKQLEFFLSNFIYSQCGMKYIPVSDSIKPDILIVYDYSNDYQEKYIAPKAYTIPYWKSGSIINSTINSTSSGSLNVAGDVNLTGNALGSKQTTINTTTPGEWTQIQIQKPGYSEGKYYPNLSLIIYETSNNKKVWEGIGTGTSDNKDFRLSGQFIMTNLGVKIPVGSYNYEELTEENNGQVGFNFIIFNSDGQNFYPVILNVFKDSPAYAKGLKFEDIILTVNGISTTNKSVKQTMLLLRGNAGTKISLTIERTDRILNKTLIKTLRPSAK